MRPMNDSQLILLIVPILVIQLGLIALALRDLLTPERRVRGDNKLVWGLIIVFISLIGPILYFVAGREEE
jgi:Phospholipase_D-nuclease N-terminal